MFNWQLTNRTEIVEKYRILYYVLCNTDKHFVSIDIGYKFILLITSSKKKNIKQFF